MPRLFAWLLPLLLFSSLHAQTTQAPQTARQALIEMFFGSAPNHLEKHLPSTTRNALKEDERSGRSEHARRILGLRKYGKSRRGEARNLRHRPDPVASGRT